MADTVTMPKLGFDMAEGTLVRWLKKEGETVSKGDILAEIETDKATVEVESSASGVVRKLLVDEGEVVPVNAPIAVVGTADEKIEEPVAEKTEKRKQAVMKPVEAQIEQPAPVLDAVSVQTGDDMRASPLAKKIARENKLDLRLIRGSGPGGRIVRKDVETALLTGKAVTGKPAPAVLMPSSSLDGGTVAMSRLRQAIGRRMVESKTTLPHFYVTHEYDMGSLLDMREQLNKIVPPDEKISVNDFILKAVALTLHQFPNLNASLDRNSIRQHGQVNIGVAVAVEGGLLTVVCRDTDQKSLRQIAVEVRGMAKRVREGKVKPEDIEGSTFSISNLGMFEVENFTAIINPPEAAILAVGSARQVAVVQKGTIVPGWRMKATISVDHRISDGAEAAKFMQALAVFLEEPLRLVVQKD